MENEPQACEPQAAARQEEDGRWRKGSPWQLAGFTLIIGLVISVVITGISALMSGVLPPMGVFLSMSSIAGISAGLSAIIAWNVKRSQWLGFALLASVVVSIILAGILSFSSPNFLFSFIGSFLFVGMSMSIALISIIVWSSDRSQWVEFALLTVAFCIGIGVIGTLTMLGGKVSGVFSNINSGCADLPCSGSYSLLSGGSKAQKAPAMPQAPSPMPQVTAAVESETTAKEKEERKKDGAVAETPAPTPVQPVRPNSFTLASEDHLSTFAIDVDTASYTSARNYLKNGSLPAPDTVRIEEFVNYFPYNYPNPGEETFGIYVDAAPAPWNTTPEQNTYLIRVGVHGKEIEASKRDPAILTFVIDVSGSMNEPRRLPLVKESLTLLVKNLQEIDQVGIVTYGDTAQVVLQPTSVAERDKIIQAIEGLVNDGSTNAEEGLRLGYEMASRFAKKGVTNRVILCSDGVANVGATGPDEILKRVSDYAGQGIYLTTVGFGMGDFNDYLMEQLADKGNGNYAYVDTLAAARKVFERDLTGTLQVIAKDVKIQVDFNPAIVEQYRLLGYENRAVADVDFRNDKVDAGEIGAGHTVTALYEVVLASAETGKALTVQLRYQDPKTGEVKEIAQPFNRESLRLKFEDTSPQFQLAVAAAGFAGYLRDGKPSLAEVQAVTRRMAPQWKENGDTLEFIDLVEKAKQRP